MTNEHDTHTTAVTVTLTPEQWKVVGFLVQRGAMHELESQLTQPSRHCPDCLSSFVATYTALSEQLPELLPQVPAEAKAETLSQLSPALLRDQAR